MRHLKQLPLSARHVVTTVADLVPVKHAVARVDLPKYNNKVLITQTLESCANDTTINISLTLY